MPTISITQRSSTGTGTFSGSSSISFTNQQYVTCVSNGRGTLTFKVCNLSGAVLNTYTATVTPSPGCDYNWYGVKSEYSASATIQYEFTGTPTPSQYRVTTYTSPSGSGSVSQSGSGTYLPGTPVTLRANAASGYEFDHWSDGSTGTTITFIMPSSNVSYTAYFKTATPKYTVNASSANENMGTVSPTSQSITQGGQATITATPKAGYEFSFWRCIQGGRSDSTDNPLTISAINSAMTWVAYFVEKPKYRINVTSSGSGLISYTILPENPTFAGREVMLTATIDNVHYSFVSCTLNGNRIDPSSVQLTTYTFVFNMPAAIANIVITTTPKVFDLTGEVYPAEAGEILGLGEYSYGTTHQVWVLARQGWIFDHWEDGSTSQRRDVLINGDKHVTAYFVNTPVTKYHKLNVSSEPEHAGYADGTGVYKENKWAEANAYPEELHEFVGWDNGAENNPLEIKMTKNIDIIALFERRPEIYVGDSRVDTIFIGNTEIELAAVGNTNFYLY